MKRICSAALVLGLMLAINNTLQAQNRLGIFAGPQITRAKYRINEAHQPVTARYGMSAGLTYKVVFDNQLFFTPALFYSQKGYKVTFNQQATPPSRMALNNDVRVHTLETALLLHYDFSTQPGHFFIKAGPSFDISLAGREKFDTLSGSKPVSRPMTFSFASYGYTTTSMMLHLGYETKNSLFFSVFYSHGMGNFNNADDGPDIRHRVAGLNLGYYFKRKSR